jgi:plastocyanin
VIQDRWSRSRREFMACACGSLLLFGWTGPEASEASATVHTITIEGMHFIPPRITVRQGDRVTWVNRDLFPHTATADRFFDSHDIGPGASWTYVAMTPGEYPYRCTLHPTMQALLVVE